MFDRNLATLPGMRRMLVLCVVFALVRGLLIVGQCFALASAIVTVWEGASLTSQLGAVVMFAVCLFGRQVVKTFEERLLERYAATRMAVLRQDVLDRLWETSEAMAATYGTASVATMLVSEIDDIGRYLTSILPKTVSVIVVPLCIVIAVFTQDWVSGLIIVVCYPFIMVFMRLIGHTASDESAKRLRGFAAMSSSFLDALRGMSTLRAFRISKAYADKVFAASESYRRAVMRTLRIATLSSTVLDIFATCGLAAVAIMLGFRMVEGSVAFLPALTTLMLVPEFFMPVKAYASDYHATLDGRSALEKVCTMLACEPRHVSLLQEGITIEDGERIALIGRSGSGKSSLLSAIAGTAVPDAGLLQVAGTVPSACEEWQARVALIPQRPHLLDGTLRENVAFYAPFASDEAVERAVRDAGLGSMLDELPEGLDTRIGHNGRGLSAGQAQRLSIARALVDETRDIWLLDEPGANLDDWTERELKRAVFEAVGSRTLVVATHRLHWTDDVDRVIDLDEMVSRAHEGRGDV